jgi:hypothetical protein
MFVLIIGLHCHPTRIGAGVHTHDGAAYFLCRIMYVGFDCVDLLPLLFKGLAHAPVCPSLMGEGQMTDGQRTDRVGVTRE